MGRSGNPAKAALPKPPAWTPFKRLDPLYSGEQVWSNSRFTVIVALKGDRAMGWSGIEGNHDAHLSFKRLDRRPEFSWRDVQRMKSELCGSEAEALEVYPAESRTLDASNQRHLFVWRADNPNRPRLGFFGDRQVADQEKAEAALIMGAALSGAKAPANRTAPPVQEPWEDGMEVNLGNKGVIWQP